MLPMVRQSDGGVRISARWDMLKYGPVPLAHGVFVPERLTAIVERDGDHTVEIDISVEDGKLVCDAVRVFRNPERPSLTGHELRRLEVSEWMIRATAKFGVGNQEGVVTTPAAWGTDEYRTDVEGVVRRSQRRNQVTEEDLRTAAEIYREHADTRNPTATVAKQLSIGRSTAARWVALARERGYLPPAQGEAATSRKPVEDSELGGES